MLRAIVLALFGLVGCVQTEGAGANTDLVFSYQGSPQGFGAANWAAAQWNTCPGVHIEINQPGGEGALLIATPGPRTGMTTKGFDGQVVRVEFIDEYPGGEAYALYELGHAVGVELALDQTRARAIVAARKNKTQAIEKWECP